MDRNEATKLTPAERKEKKIRKLVGASGDPALTACVYVVTDLSSTQHQWKVRVNAEVVPACLSAWCVACGRR